MSTRSNPSTLTPLGALFRSLCGRRESSLFENQVILFQLLVPFLGDQFSVLSPDYSPSSVDELILEIRRYLSYVANHPLASNSDEAALGFVKMHRFICNNLLGEDYDKKTPAIHGDISILSFGNGQSYCDIRSNISRTIHAKRALPLRLRKLLRTDGSNYSLLLYRCFWLLQYYLVYYSGSYCQLHRTQTLISNVSLQLTEYFSLTPAKATSVYSALHKSCRTYSSYFSDSTHSGFNLMTLSRVILDVVIAQINLMQQIPLDQISNAALHIQQTESSITELGQYLEFQNYLGGFGNDSYDRYQMLLRFAPKNCYAAAELADVYYWGRTYWIRENNYFDVDQNYQKAAEWYLKSIEQSSPPLQTACWSLAYTLMNIRYNTKSEQKQAKEKAIGYLTLAGDYPAAQNRLATYHFQDGEALYTKSSENDHFYNQALDKFTEAICLADKAGAMNWFYGNNQIAQFLRKHASDQRLISDLSKRLKLHIPLDEEAQLVYSASFHGPWAMKHLGLYYIRNGAHKKAFPLLRQAMNAGYNEAFYETAVHFHSVGDEQWARLMNEASKRNCPKATYELAQNAKETEEKQRLLELCRQQLLAERQLNTELLQQVEMLQHG